MLRDDLELRDRVTFWERELTPLAGMLSVAAPSAKVWELIAARIAPRDRAATAKRSWFARWFDLRTAGSLAAGVVVGVAATLLAPSLLFTRTASVAEVQLPESYVGVLATGDGRVGAIVSSQRHGKVIDVKQVEPVPVPAGQTLFLWTIAADGTTKAIGPVPQGNFVHVPLGQTAETLFSTARELALSIEPLGATPVAPSASYVYRGLCGKLWPVSPP